MYSINFYKKQNGKRPVEDFLDSIADVKLKQRAAWLIKKLEEHGKSLPYPYSSYLREGIFELRVIHANNHVRILYFFLKGKIIILTNAFTKKTQKTPLEEVERAIRYKKDCERRSESYE